LIGNKNKEEDNSATTPAAAVTKEKEQKTHSLSSTNGRHTGIVDEKGEEKDSRKGVPNNNNNKKEKEKATGAIVFGFGARPMFWNAKWCVRFVVYAHTVHGVSRKKTEYAKHEQICTAYIDKSGVVIQIHRVAAAAQNTASFFSRISSTTLLYRGNLPDGSTPAHAWQQKVATQCVYPFLQSRILEFAMSGSGSGTKKTGAGDCFSVYYISQTSTRSSRSSHGQTCHFCGYWMETASERSLTPQKALVGIYQL
jgi:hypothetical protein